ncbi:MAG: hypothetical protein R2734_05105 [Nocardioides sp.]
MRTARSSGLRLVGPPDAAYGVVLRQGASQTICEWLPWAGDVAEQAGAGCCSSTDAGGVLRRRRQPATGRGRPTRCAPWRCCAPRARPGSP